MRSLTRSRIPITMLLDFSQSMATQSILPVQNWLKKKLLP
jgi:hypothetical protein